MNVESLTEEELKSLDPVTRFGYGDWEAGYKFENDKVITEDQVSLDVVKHWKWKLQVKHERDKYNKEVKKHAVSVFSMLNRSNVKTIYRCDEGWRLVFKDGTSEIIDSRGSRFVDTLIDRN